MKERSERLFSAMSQLSDAHIDEAAEPFPAAKSSRRQPWRRWGTAAACVAVIAMTVTIFPHIGGCGSSGAPESGENADSFLSYAGPILPLTLQTPDDALTAERTVTLDFAPWVPQWRSNEEEAASRTELTAAQRQEVLADYNEWYPEGGRWLISDDLLVRDDYVLTNQGEARTVTVQLPFISDLTELAAHLPALTLDGEVLDGTLVAGYRPAGSELTGWENCQTLLADGSYRAEAREPYGWQAEEPVTVYAFTDAWGPERDRDARPNPTVQAAFDLDCDRSQVLSMGFNGGRNDWEAGRMIREFSIPDSREREQTPALLVVLGEDVRHLTTSFHVTGGSDPDTPRLEDAGVTVTRYETTLAPVLRWALDQCHFTREEDDPLPLDGDALYNLFLDQLQTAYQPDLSDALHTGGMLEDQLELLRYTQRVFWLQAEVTLETGESRTLSAVSRKTPSRNYGGSGPESVVGFDLMPWLDSCLDFTAQTAVLEDRGQIGLVRQSFGFDPENGVLSVQLDEEVPHYSLEVERTAEVPDGAPAADS